MSNHEGIFVFDWRCPYCGCANCDLSDQLDVTCQECGGVTNYENESVEVTQQQPLSIFVQDDDIGYSS